jgi:hypothetical protein
MDVIRVGQIALPPNGATPNAAMSVLFQRQHVVKQKRDEKSRPPRSHHFFSLSFSAEVSHIVLNARIRPTG